MKALLALFLMAFLFMETLQGADARSWSGRQLGDTGKGNVGGTTTVAATPATPTTTSSLTASTPSTKTGYSPADSSIDGTAGSVSSTGSGNNDDDFWDSPSQGDTHHVHLDYNHPGRRAL